MPAVSVGGAAAAAGAIAAMNAARLNRERQEAFERYRESCRVTMPEYNARTATVQEMRDYANCVGAVHPLPQNPSHPIGWGEIGWGEIVVVVFIVAGILGGGALLLEWITRP